MYFLSCVMTPSWINACKIAEPSHNFNQSWGFLCFYLLHTQLNCKMRFMYLVEQQYQAVFQCWRTTKIWVSASSQQPQQWMEDGHVLQQRLLGLTDEHLKQLEQRPLAV